MFCACLQVGSCVLSYSYQVPLCPEIKNILFQYSSPNNRASYVLVALARRRIPGCDGSLDPTRIWSRLRRDHPPPRLVRGARQRRPRRAPLEAPCRRHDFTRFGFSYHRAKNVVGFDSNLKRSIRVTPDGSTLEQVENANTTCGDTGEYGILLILYHTGQSDEDTSCTQQERGHKDVRLKVHVCGTESRRNATEHLLLRVRVLVYVISFHYSAENPPLVGNIKVGCWTAALAPRTNKGHSHGPWPSPHNPRRSWARRTYATSSG